MFKRLFIAIILLGLIGGGIVWFKFFRDDMIAQYLGGMVPAPTPVTTETVATVTWSLGSTPSAPPCRRAAWIWPSKPAGWCRR
ncbi:hypothetical protein MASR1M32_23060 [Rhodobacter sp.]